MDTRSVSSSSSYNSSSSSGSSFSFIKDTFKYIICVDAVPIGLCSFHFFATNKKQVVHINSLLVEINFRNRGYGTLLLYEVLYDVYVTDHITHVELMDISVKHGQPDNIYRKLGLHYNWHGNKMCGNLRHILYGKICRSKKFAKIKNTVLLS
jgi:hypothetical protein